MKKLLSMIMAIAMVASLAATAFASDFEVKNDGDSVLEDSTKTVTSTVKSKVKAPTIKVTIPTTNNVFLNPYKMSVTVNSVAKTGEIVSIPATIKSESDVKLDFSAVVTGKPSTGVTLEKASVKDSDGKDTKKTNSVYMYVYFANAADATAAAAVAPPTDATNLIFTATDSASANAIVVQPTASKSTKILTLAAAASSSAPTYGAYVIGGDIVAAPTTPWTDKHTVDVTVAFSIAPVQGTGATTSSTGG